MSRINELIEKLCPNGVEYKELGEAVNILDNLRKPISKEKRTKGNYPYYGANGIQDYVLDYIFEGTFLLMGEDGSVIKKDGSPILNWATGKIWVNNHAHVLSEKRNIALLRFIFYYLSTIDVTLIVHGTPPKINQANLRSITIPIPPLEIQEEIVRILDNFTALEAELEAELEARKKQYEYYRNKLLSFEGKDVEWKTLGEVCTFEYGKSLKESERKGGIYPVMGSNGKVGLHDVFLVSGPCIIVGRKGSAGAINWVDENCYPIDTTYYLNLKTNKIDLRFLYQYLISIGLTPETKSGGVPGLNRNEAYQKNIPLPSLSEQKRIVDILDKFDSLVNDISIGLPAEIEARRKQYEYYRGKLLSFKEINNG